MGHTSIHPALHCSRGGGSFFIGASLLHRKVHHACPALAPASHLQVNAELYRTDPDIPLFMCAQRVLYLLAAYQVIIFTGGTGDYCSPAGASSWGTPAAVQAYVIQPCTVAATWVVEWYQYDGRLALVTR